MIFWVISYRFESYEEIKTREVQVRPSEDPYGSMRIFFNCPLTQKRIGGKNGINYIYGNIGLGKPKHLLSVRFTSDEFESHYFR